MKKLLVVDGNSLINRAFYGIRDLSNSKGLPTNAVFGFVSTLKKYVDRLKPDYAVCAFDTRKPTFRHEMYIAYKSNRKGMPDELGVQLPYAKRAAKHMGFCVVEAPGYEADDIIGSVCRLADCAGDIESYILTGDRDSLQLISDRTTVILMRNKGDEEFDRVHFFEEYGVDPDQLVDVKALMGDSSDCIPGVAGIGEKTALKLIRQSGDLDKLYAAESDGFFGSSPSVRKKLTEGRESAILSRELARINREVPCVCDLNEFISPGYNRSELKTLFLELEFDNFISKFGLFGEEAAAEAEEVTYSFREIDSETLCSLSISDAAVSFNGEVLSVYTAGEAYVCRQLTDAALSHVFSSPIICHDCKALYKRLLPYGICPKCCFDTMLGKYLIDTGKGSYPLGTVAEYCGFRSPESIETEAEAIYLSYEVLEEKLREAGMSELNQELEIPLSTVLAEIENVGFKVDAAGIRAYSLQLLDMEEQLSDSIFSLAGHDFNINSPKQLGEVLFEELGLPSGKKTKTGYSTGADTLKKLRYYHPIVSEILSYRQVSKLRSTYGDALADMADEDDRIHTSFNQCGTATGRLSSNEPNLQNIPVRGELGREIRKYFIATGEDYRLIDADYSQIELRILAHLSGDENMIAAFRSGTDIHTATAAQVFGIPEGEVTKELRARAKAVNFGIIYGIGAFSLAQDIGCTKKEADEYIKSYFATYPKIEGYLSRTVADASETGYTTTMFGRRRKIPELKSSNKNVVAFGKRIAMNSPIQGTAADVIKVAMINVSRALSEAGIDARLIMQVHDELIVEANVNCVDRAREILVREMEAAADLMVPLTAEAAVGASWYDAK